MNSISPMLHAATKNFEILPLPSSPVNPKPLSPLSPIFGPTPTATGTALPSVFTLAPAMYQESSYGKITPISVIMTCIKNLDNNKHNLSGWVFKKNNYKGNKIYTKEYLFIRDHHLIWNKEKIKKKEITNVNVNGLKKNFRDLFIFF